MKLLIFIIFSLSPAMLLASTAGGDHLDLTNHWVGFTAIAVFTFAYL